MTTTQPDSASEANIRLLVDGFYANVVQDALLGPVFSDFAHVDWPHHLPVMYDFWSSLLLEPRATTADPFPSTGRCRLRPPTFSASRPFSRRR